MITELEIKAYRRAAATVAKAAADASAYRGAFDDEASRRLRLVVAEAEIELHDRALALDAADEAVAEIDALARRAARARAAAEVRATVPRLESCTVDAVERFAAAFAAALPKAAEREAAEHAWFATYAAVRDAIELHTAERQARGLPRAHWFLPSTPEWRELLGERPAPPWCASVGVAGALRREMPGAGGFTDRPARARGSMPGDLEDGNARARAG